jgi:hypothetical protein
MKDVNVGIKKLDFTEYRGKMVVYLTDGRELIVPLSLFPDIKHLSVKDREGWMILDDQYFTFNHLSKVYSVKDIMSLS